MRDKFRASIKLLLIILWLLLVYAGLWLASLTRNTLWRDRLIRLCNHGLLIILGIRLTVNGDLSRHRPLLLVTNHVSYLDIILIAACSTVRFTPKSDIGNWFFIGSFCRLCGSVFIDRRADQVVEMKRRLHESLLADDVVCLFPEATTGNGIAVKDFKSGFFNLAKEDFAGRHLYVQPAALVYTHIGGLPLDSSQMPMIAWYGDMDLMPHLWQLLMLPSLRAEMVFLPVISTKNQQDRKKLAADCQQQVADAIEALRQRRVAKH